MNAFEAAGQAEKAIPMLEASEKAFPEDYNPPARLALVYLWLKQYDTALAASDRALERVYGPRKLRVLAVRADIYKGMGNAAEARKTVEESLAYAEALPAGQRSETAIALAQEAARRFVGLTRLRITRSGPLPARVRRARPVAAAEGEDRQLQALFDEAWAFRLAEDPLFATSAGDHRYDDKLPSMTHADLERRAAYARSALERLKAIDRAALSAVRPGQRGHARAASSRTRSPTSSSAPTGSRSTPTAASTPTSPTCPTACRSRRRRTTRTTSRA